MAQFLNYRLQALYAQSGAPVVRMLEGRYGITRREWRLLAWLAESGPKSPSALAEAAQLDRARTSRAIANLVQKGLVQRVAEADDSRRAVVSIRPPGQALYQKVFPVVARLNAQLVEVLDDNELRVLDRALERLTAHARDVNKRVAAEIKTMRRAGGTRRILP